FSQKLNKQRLAQFAALLKQMSRKIGFRVSSRGWCYLLEQGGAINKDQFNKVESWVNRCRRDGLIPIDFVADESARQFQGVEVPTDQTPGEWLNVYLDAATDCENNYDVDWWHGERYYIQMVVEKIDLVTLFEPVCRQYHIPIANSKGWSSMLQRAEYSRRFKEARQRGLKCVLLYCGDHDPDGLRISTHLRNNLQALRDIKWRDGWRGYDPHDLTIDRFGLNYDFIQQHGFSWINNLITGSGRNLASPEHRNYHDEYVQDYLETVGARKCEANALVTKPKIAASLCRGAIEKYLGPDAKGRFRARRGAVCEYMAELRERTGVSEFLTKASETIADEATIMSDRTWLME
ncbi:MAG: hypothetical protein ACYS7Y_27420, partial [Planctomycetota bacterium]